MKGKYVGRENGVWTPDLICSQNKRRGCIFRTAPCQLCNAITQQPLRISGDKNGLINESVSLQPQKIRYCKIPRVVRHRAFIQHEQVSGGETRGNWNGMEAIPERLHIQVIVFTVCT